MTTLDQRIDRILKAGGKTWILPGGNYYGTGDWNVSERGLSSADEENFAAFVKVLKARVAKKKASK